jgi:peptide/nickel transport system substrate-binding protein
MRHFRFRTIGGVASAVAVTALAAACSSSPSTGGSAGGSGATVSPGWQALNRVGTPTTGGTLNMIGVSDVQYMDYDTAYYTTDSLFDRMTLRSLYNWPAQAGNANFQPVPDLATAMPTVSADGLTESVTIRSGVMWDSTPPRPVTAQDVVRGIKRACNPSPVSFGGMADFEGTVKGLTAFCRGYPTAAGTNAAALKAYVEDHNVSGITTSGNTITFHLTQPAAWFTGAMTLGPFFGTPIEALNALPGTPGVYNHMLSDGPYKLVSYTPAKSMSLVRNPEWSSATDPLRKAYVDAINVNQTGNQSTIYQEIGTGSPALALTWDSRPPASDTSRMLDLIQSNSGMVNLGRTFSTNPYVVFNTISPNNRGALGKVSVRQALSYALDRTELIKTLGGPTVNPPLTHVLPPGIDGAQHVPADYDPYPYNQDKAKSMLTAAGFSSSNPLVFKLLYRTTEGSTKAALNIQTQLQATGLVKVDPIPTNQSDFYGKYLSVPTSPSPAKQGVWDGALASWGPDWFGNGALTFFNPLFSAPGGYPPNGGSNFGYFNDPTVNSLITTALAQKTEPEADVYWAKADMAVMSAAAFYPITAELALAEHAPYVHNAVYMTQYQQFDPTNVWLSSGS